MGVGQVIRRRLSTLALTIACAAPLALTACGSDDPRPPNQPPPGRLAPVEAEYSLKTTPVYYENLQKALEQYQTAYGNYTTEAAVEAVNGLQEQPVAEWVVGDGDDASIDRALEAAKGTVPVFVLYHIPDRDLEQFSAGGADTAAEYQKWARGISKRIGTRNSVVVIEPDALAHIPDMQTPEEASQRVRLLAQTLKLFAENNPNTAVYLDAGNSGWRTANQTADLLGRVERAGAEIPGIALNISNFRTTEETHKYSEAISKAFGRPLYTLVDVSRNGAAPPDRQWCNPGWALIGKTTDRVFDPQELFEDVFIKRPAESDGVCGASTQPAGHFDNNLMWLQLGQMDIAEKP
ncbi:glycoside hydrolase family 6 protein [Gordonia sp. (in: high G+C Gram-positive bacteria)]|uniref:glycoside hydrolase family 6 protein n=1 Tax=Gordonia sp. (in: high G+C Gram-positive bacteria) TaxID=84139 RepID=UPI003C7151C0